MPAPQGRIVDDITGNTNYGVQNTTSAVTVDATYNWVEDDRDFTLIRGGIRIPF